MLWGHPKRCGCTQWGGTPLSSSGQSPGPRTAQPETCTQSLQAYTRPNDSGYTVLNAVHFLNANYLLAVSGIRVFGLYIRVYKSMYSMQSIKPNIQRILLYSVHYSNTYVSIRTHSVRWERCRKWSWSWSLQSGLRALSSPDALRGTLRHYKQTIRWTSWSSREPPIEEAIWTKCCSEHSVLLPKNELREPFENIP